MSFVRNARQQSLYRRFFAASEYTLEHQRHDGRFSEPVTREVFERPDGVVVLPYDPENRCIVMVEQFRMAAYSRYGDSRRSWLLEMPAGLVDGDEAHEHTAVRELKEETGLAPSGALEHLYSCFPSPGGCNERLHLYACTVDTSGYDGGVHGLDSENEDIKVHVLSYDALPGLVAEQRIFDASSIMALQWLKIL